MLQQQNRLFIQYCNIHTEYRNLNTLGVYSYKAHLFCNIEPFSLSSFLEAF